MFGIESDDVEVTTASSLLGIKSAITISNIILNIIIVLLCRLEKDNKNKLLMYILYLVSAILLEITCIIGMLNYKTTISLMTILIIITIILSILKKNKHIIKYIPIFALPVITKLIQEKIFNNNIVVTLKSIFTINLLSKLNCIVNVIIYLSSFILINMVFIFLIDKFALLINKLAKELVKFSKIKED
jgi:hypothetical protein